MTASRIYVLLSRAGDVLNALPILHRDLTQIGLRSTLMTTSPYHELLDGVSYGEAIVWPGSPHDIAGAVAAAKKLSPDVRCLHVPVTPDEVKAGRFKNMQTDSWAKEAYRLGGQTDLWAKNAPLIFDKRDVAREDALTPDYMFEKKPTVLLHCGGVSSPFRYKKLLRTLLELRFSKGRGWKILDLSTIKAHRLYDLLGLFEKARFLVTTDSAPLHLARAVPTLPVVALQNDRPGLWNGSPWRTEHIWNCRYADFPDRAASMLATMDELYQGPDAYNPCRLPPCKGNRVAHAFSAYEGISDEAAATWRQAYASYPGWIHCPAWFGVFGRDSRTLGDKLRFPTVKDVIRMAASRLPDAKDQIILTRGDTCFDWPLTGSSEPFVSHRCTRDDVGNLTHHPAIDVFAFTKQWWNEHKKEYPDFIMGRDYLWQRALKQLILRHGGKELPWLTYQAKHGND